MTCFTLHKGLAKAVCGIRRFVGKQIQIMEMYHIKSLIYVFQAFSETHLCNWRVSDAWVVPCRSVIQPSWQKVVAR